MTRKTKMISIIASIALVVCVGVVGVFAALNQTVGINTTLSYTTADISGSFRITETGAMNKTGEGATAKNFDSGVQSFDASTTSIPAQAMGDLFFKGEGETNAIVYKIATSVTGSRNGIYSFNITDVTELPKYLHVSYYHGTEETPVYNVVSDGNPLTETEGVEPLEITAANTSGVEIETGTTYYTFVKIHWTDDARELPTFNMNFSVTLTAKTAS